MKSLIKSIICAFNGLGFVIYNERNMRIHICFALFVTYFSRFYNFSKEKYILLFLTICIVLFAEITNTAIEHVVNLQSMKFNVFAKIAKDVSAAAVLVSSIISLIIGYILFFDVRVIGDIIIHFLENTSSLLFLISSIIICLYFIFYCGNRNKKTGGSKWVLKVRLYL